MKPKVSIVMPVYNAGLFLREAIESILSQTYQNFEFIIIEDGSNDNSLQIIKSFNDTRICLIQNEKNRGLVYSLNKGIVLSTGKYIARMDADDISMPTRLEKQVVFLEQNLSVAVLATKLLLVNENNKEIGVWPEDNNSTTKQQIKRTLPIINCIGHPTVMMRTSIVKSIGYNKDFLHCEDWGLWLDVLSKEEQIDKLDEFLLKYRVHSSSTTVKSNTKGVEKKIILFKFSYLKNKILKRKLKGTDYDVLTSFFKDCLKYFLKTVIPGFPIFVKIYRTNFLKLITQFWNVRKTLSTVEQPVSNIFFFPSYNTGGADRVHASILETVAEKKSLVFITSTSSNDALLSEFRKSATIIDIPQLLLWPFTRRWLTKKIIAQCNNNKDLILFGCNSQFFYNLISTIPEQTQAIDLIHAFSHSHEDSPEKWSLPVINKLSHRIVINKKTQKDLEEMYKQEGIDSQLINRIVCISNFVDKHNFEKKIIEDKLKVVYVGRGSVEKRVHLIARVARLLIEKKLEVQFHFIGDVKNAIEPEDLPFCILHGEINNQKTLDDIYDRAHVLVMASSREGFPMVIMEAMMKGVVPISTNVGGISEHIINNENGILINAVGNEGVISEIASAIEYLQNNRIELNTMSENAHAYALQHFDKKTFVESYKNMLTN